MLDEADEAINEANARGMGGDTDLMDLAEPITTEQRLEQIIREADEEAAYHATEAKRRKGVAKAARQALKIQREGDDS